MTVNVGSTAQWRQILSSSSIVVTDFHAQWCGPCKMIAPTFESLSTKFSKPNKITFAKVDVDQQRDIASQYNVRSMPTFLILRNGTVIDTIQGANPPALSAAVEKAVKLAGATPGSAFSSGGRTLGGNIAAKSSTRQPLLGRPRSWDLNNFVNALITFFGLYFTSLFSFDPYMSAQNSQFNVRNPVGPAARPATNSGSNSGSGGQKLGGAPRSSVRTLADL